ncbi:MAG: hypothetical protein N3D84_03675, partial [Candidatus Woesearchaeota archaeon]|nr:hypothetical protein [Candidatus Woesearchaeota archaeon]
MADNDEFSIDFSKVIGLFKKKKKAAKLKEKGIKENIEAGVEESSKEKPHSEAEVSFQLRDIRRIWNFIVRNKTVFLILIPIIFAVFLRSQTFYLPVTDVWAENTVKNYYASQIANQIDAQYPNLPMQNKQAMVQKELDNFIKAHETEYKEQVKQLSHNFKQHFKDETGQTYLLEIDTYQWFRHGKNILDHGYIGDKKING